MYVYSSPLRPLDSEQHSFPSGRVAAVSVLPPWERREPLRVYTALDSWLSPRPWSPSLYWFLRGTDLKKSKICPVNWGINLSDFSIINKWVPLELECTIERITTEKWIFFYICIKVGGRSQQHHQDKEIFTGWNADEMQ